MRKNSLKTRVEQLQVQVAAMDKLYSELRVIPYRVRKELRSRLRKANRHAIQLRKEVVGY